MAHLAIIEAYEEFMASAHSCVNIKTESDYQGALETLESVMESASDTLDDPLNPLIDMISHAIEEYESQDQELMAFIAEAGDMSADVALLKTLMSQHGLTGSEVPEIGDKTMVSKVLNGKRQLTRQAIERLSDRFGIRPAMFFGEVS